MKNTPRQIARGTYLIGLMRRSNTHSDVSLHHLIYCQTFDIMRTLVGNKTVAHLDVVGAAPVGAAPTTSSFSN